MMLVATFLSNIAGSYNGIETLNGRPELHKISIICNWKDSKYEAQKTDGTHKRIAEA